MLNDGFARNDADEDFAIVQNGNEVLICRAHDQRLDVPWNVAPIASPNQTVTQLRIGSATRREIVKNHAITPIVMRGSALLPIRKTAH